MSWYLHLTMTAAAVVVVGGVVAAAWAVITRRWWEGREHLAAAYGSIGLGLTGYALFYVWLADRAAGWAVTVVVLLAATGVCSAAAGRQARRRGGPGARFGALRRDPLLVVLLVASVLVLQGSLFLLWDDRVELFSLARVRFSHPLPWDNQLPELIARRLEQGQHPQGALEGWLTSDRPPTQTGLLLLFFPLAGLLRTDPTTLAAVTGIAAQLVWVPGVFAVCRSLGMTRLATSTATTFAALAGTVLVNTVFSWPKLLSAGLLLCGLAVAVDARHRVTSRARTVPVSVAAVGCTVAFLAHGTAVFAAPVVLIVLWYGPGHLRRRADLLGPVVVSLALYVPWAAYQRFVDPPGDRLLLWHLAGVVEPTDEGLLAALLRTYTTRPVREILADKVANLELPVSGAPWAGLSAHGWDATARRSAEFFTVSGAVGLGVVPLGLLLAWTVLHRGHLTPMTRRVIRLLAVVLGCLLLWALVLHGPGTTWLHHGSHALVLLLIALPAGWVATRSPVAGLVLCGVQAAVLLATYGPGGPDGHLHLAALAGVVVGLGGLLAGLLAARPVDGTEVDREDEEIAGTGSGPGDPAPDESGTRPPVEVRS